MIIKVDNGRLCGAFSSINLKSDGGWTHDDKAFVFSLDLLKKYNTSTQGHRGHVYFNGSYGPYFGDNGSIGVYSSPLNNTNSGYCRIN